MSADATRVLRVVGTLNSKADNFRVTAELIDSIRYDVDWLADQVLEKTRAQIRDTRAAPRACSITRFPPRKARSTAASTTAGRSSTGTCTLS